MSVPDLDIFANRLRKMDRHIGKWARRQDISCYRIYDADVPEFPLVVDRYEDYLHVAEYRRRHALDEEAYRIWRSGSRQVLLDVLDCPPQNLYWKERKPQKGNQQYEKRDDQQREIVAREGGLRFIVNLSDYLDTGLFLDHRPTRAMVRERAAGKRVLNLFAYTGSFTVYAADGGAASTCTIDLSNTYLDWARRNLELNGLPGPQHAFIRADVLAWLRDPPSGEYDLIVLDPPTFSNSKRMDDILDVQRDHPELIRRCLRRLSPEGTLFFSTNFRKFRLEEQQLDGAVVYDITAQTIPNDFRNKRIHYCFEIRKGATPGNNPSA